MPNQKKLSIAIGVFIIALSFFFIYNVYVERSKLENSFNKAILSASQNESTEEDSTKLRFDECSKNPDAQECTVQPDLEEAQTEIEIDKLPERFDQLSEEKDL